nr:hypothetical protein [Parvularcula maris]
MTEADWSREKRRGWNPGGSLLAAIRSYARLKPASGPLAALARGLAVLRHRFWSAVSGADIPIGTEIGGGLRLPHPNGIVVHPKARIGINCMIMQGVTIGTNVGPGSPMIGAGCDIGPGARVLGAITIGDRAMIGANAVVLKDMPPGSLAVGVPAKIITDWNDRRGTVSAASPGQQEE